MKTYKLKEIMLTALALGGIYLLIVGALQFTVNTQEMIAKGYIQSHCELLSSPHNVNNKWYECDQ